jgi:hypothetical protein
MFNKPRRYLGVLTRIKQNFGGAITFLAEIAMESIGKFK